MKEKDLVNSFEEACHQDSRFTFLHKETAPNPPTPHMDTEFIFNGCYIRAEVKYVHNDVRRLSQSALSLFGAILKGRKLTLASPNDAAGKQISYALVLHHSNEQKYRKIYANIDKSDWVKFGTSYKVKNIFIVNHNGGILVKKWSTFLD